MKKIIVLFVVVFSAFFSTVLFASSSAGQNVYTYKFRVFRVTNTGNEVPFSGVGLRDLTLRHHFDSTIINSEGRATATVATKLPSNVYRTSLTIYGKSITNAPDCYAEQDLRNALPCTSNGSCPVNFVLMQGSDC